MSDELMQELNAVLNNVKPQATATGGQLSGEVDWNKELSTLPSTLDPPSGAPAPLFSPEEEQYIAGKTNRPGYLSAFAGGAQRNWGQIKAIAPTLKGVYAEATGDEAGAAEAFKESQAIQAEAPKPLIPNYTYIHDWDDFSTWLSEALGEQSLTMLSMAATGGAGGLTANLAGRGLMMSSASRAALTKAGAVAGGLASGTALETAGTADELREATGSYHPAMAVGAGAVKGALEVYTPAMIIRGLSQPGRHLATEIGKTAIRESLTEGAQEAVDAAARSYLDPNYKFFSVDNAVRITEAMAKGFVSGGVYGGGTEAAVHKWGQAKHLQRPGEERELTPEEIKNLQVKQDAETEAARPTVEMSGPLGWLRKTFQRRSEASADQLWENDQPNAADPLDAAGAVADLRREVYFKKIQADQAEQITDLVDDLTPRYVLQKPDGTSDGRLYTATDLHVARAMEPQGEQLQAVKVDMQKLAPGHITAELRDLPRDMQSKRIYTLPGTSVEEEAQLRIEYGKLVPRLISAQNSALDAGKHGELSALYGEYEQLLHRGLRVIPEKGQSFHYKGAVSGERIELSDAKSGLKPFTTSVDFVGVDGKLKAGHILTSYVSSKAVVVDLSKAPKGSFYGTPVLLEDLAQLNESNVVKPAGMKFEDALKEINATAQRALKADTEEQMAAEFKRLYDEHGVAVTATLGKQLIAAKDVDIKHFTYKGADNNSTLPFFAPNKKSKAFVEVTIDRDKSASVDTKKRADKFAKLLTEIYPVYSKIASSLGVQAPTIVVQEGPAPVRSPYLDLYSGVLVFPVETPFNINIQETPAGVLAIVLHELGHAFTLQEWGKLPCAIQAKVMYGYEQAKLSYRIEGVATRSGSIAAAEYDTLKNQSAYWSTFPEYLAEQFRRWAEQRINSLAVEDSFYKDVAAGMRKLSDVYSEHVADKLIKNFHEAEQGFHSWMDYFEEMRKVDPTKIGILPASAKMNVMEKVRPGVLKKLPPELKSVVVTIRKSVESLRHLLPADWKVDVSLPGDLVADAQLKHYAVAELETKVVRMVANAFSGEKGKVPFTFVHEAVHACWERFTPEERALLVREADARKVLSTEAEEWYYKYYMNSLTAGGLAVDRAEYWTKLCIQEEKAAFLLENYMARGIAQQSSFTTLLDAIVNIINKAREAVFNAGIKTAEDIIQAFLRGEVASRDTLYSRNGEPVPAKLAAFNPKDVFYREQQLLAMRKATEVSTAQAIKGMTGEITGEVIDPFTRIAAETQQRERKKAAKLLNIPVEQAAPPQIETMHIQAIFGQVFRGENNPSVDRHLAGTSSKIGAQADRISWFSKLFFGLHQLAWRNPHIPQLRQYVSLTERWNASRMRWIAKADDTARKWDKLPAVQRNALADVLFWATEMKYRTPAEVQNNVVRMPTQQELATAFQSRKMTPEAIQLYSEIAQQFNDFLTEVERVSRANIARTIRDPAAQQRALLELAADMTQMRQKPYFPMVRFGEWTITVRDPGRNNAVVWFSAYDTVAERDAAVKHVALRHPLTRIQVGRAIEEIHEFMGLPAPLLKQIKNNLPGINQIQQDWIDRLMHLNAPEQSFRKRWLHRSGTPGYSLDAFRAFANYFVKGGNYLARIEYNPLLNTEIRSLRATLPMLRDTYKRGMMIEYMQQHYRYIMEGGQDWSKMKALFALWQLGYSPIAAGMNLLQNVQVSWPYFTATFGNVKATAAMMRAMADLKKTFTFSTMGQSPAFIAAKEELVSQGKIDVGQAPELGNFAEGHRLSRLMAGDELQRAWRSFMYYGMIGFQYTEKFNRNFTFRVAWELANANPRLPILRRLGATHTNEVFDIAARRGLTQEQAVAVIFAREAIDRTQFIYSPVSRPTFLRSGPMSAFMVFFGYMQSMLYAMRHNPGAAKMWLITLGLFGLSGLPGADDLNEMLKLVARRIFGVNFNLQKEVRKYVQGLTQNTVFDKTGPDLAMHGISRYSFGLGLMGDGWGVPRFDASVNGSMAKIVPGLADLARNLSTVSSQTGWKDVTADLARNAAGAGFGQLFALLKFLQAPPGGDAWKQWEGIMPRAVKAASKAYRYASTGQETTSTGAKFVGFNVRDPDDIATIIAQALGLNPTKVSEKWEAFLTTADEIKFYQSRRLSLLAQMDDAVRSKDPKAVSAMVTAIAEFNREMASINFAGMGLTGDAIRQSLMMKARNRVNVELDIPQMKKTLPFVQEQRRLWPGVEANKVK